MKTKFGPWLPIQTGAWILTLATACLAADEPLSLRELETQVDQAIFRTINLGAPMYNQGDAAGCYRLYQGALFVIEPMLGHRADLRQEVASGMKNVERMSTFAQRATELRRLLDRVRSVIRTTAAPTPPAALPPLWVRLGGEPAVKAVVHDFVGLAAGDPQVDFIRGGKYPLDAAGVANLEKQLVDLISATTGGPRTYEGRDMKSVHDGMAITNAQFNALADDLIVVLKKYNVPKRETDELVAIIASTRKDIVEGPATQANAPSSTPAPPPPPAPYAAVPLWNRLGGEPAVKAVVHDFVGLAAGDPQVDFTRKGKFPLNAAAVNALEGHLVDLISAVSGGPRKYEGRDMKSLHQAMAITNAQFNALADDLVVVLMKYNVPRKEADELMAIIASTRKDIVTVP